jgi:hypothetical protein
MSRLLYTSLLYQAKNTQQKLQEAIISVPTMAKMKARKKIEGAREATTFNMQSHYTGDRSHNTGDRIQRTIARINLLLAINWIIRIKCKGK